MTDYLSGGPIQDEYTILTDLKIWDGEHSLEADTLILKGSRISSLSHRSSDHPK